MTSNTLRRTVPVTLALAACLTSLSAPAFATPAPASAGVATAAVGTGQERVVADLERNAQELRSTVPGGPSGDLRALSAMTKGATIVGIGEVTHGSKELFTLRHRMFRHLVQTQGFTTLALEATWSAGVRLDAYVRTGKGDLRTIMAEEFQQSYRSWRTQEWMDLYEWMRDYNRTAARKLRVMGSDIGDVNPEQYRRILAWAEKHQPSLAPELRRRYAGLLALPGGVEERMNTLAALPAERRTALAGDAQAAYRLLDKSGKASPRVLQEARVIVQMTTMYALDGSALHRHRDRAMAENTMWWQRDTGTKTVAAAHNGHIGYVSAWPDLYPVTQGAVLRSLAGTSYVAIGTTIHSGRFRATDPKTGQVAVFDTGAPVPASSEAVLDRVRHRDYYVDLRRAGRTPSTRAWLDTARPTFTIPATYVPEQFNRPLALGAAFDVIVHLNRVDAATPLR